MDYFIEFAVTFLRTKLIELMERETVTYDDLNNLVQALLNLQEEFQSLLTFIDDINTSNF